MVEDSDVLLNGTSFTAEPKDPEGGNIKQKEGPQIVKGQKCPVLNLVTKIKKKWEFEGKAGGSGRRKTGACPTGMNSLA